MKGIVRGMVFLNALAVILTAAAAWGLERHSVSDLLDLANYVGLGLGALGALVFMGSSAGTDGSTGIAASAADRPSRIMSALWMDRNAGIASGAMLVLSGGVWLSGTWLLAILIDHFQN
ncbi:hypothetical protein [Microvirga rosea]|uniref:hypothetical protein n=1 Tax=Microvirga rosea TaxID=2715425 RepID=UPI001D0B1FA6|nr:hypothetical protein [Microvirga rosea]MCB8820482.1 hypothetical protein [Microvirga rosea]